MHWLVYVGDYSHNVHWLVYVGDYSHNARDGNIKC